MTDLDGFIANLPKVELHVHHVGSAAPETVAGLAERHAGSTPVPADPELLADYFQFTDFAHFIEVYLRWSTSFGTPVDVATLTYDVAAGLAAQQVRYAELTLTPYSSVIRGMPREAYSKRSRTRGSVRRATMASRCGGASTSLARLGWPPPI